MFVCTAYVTVDEQQSRHYKEKKEVCNYSKCKESEREREFQSNKNKDEKKYRPKPAVMCFLSVSNMCEKRDKWKRKKIYDA